jgi:acylphosphatase
MARIYHTVPYNVGFMLVARRVVVSGRVQGVGFRFFVEARAAAEGVHGWVRNLVDGRVEALIEGDQESVNRVEAAIRRGPAGSHVEDVAVEITVPSGRATGFSIR